MHLYLRGDRERLDAAALDTIRAHRVWLFHGLTPTAIPEVSRLELTTGDRTLELATADVVAWFEEIFSRASL